MFGLNRAALFGGGIALALALGWGFRVDYLRAGWKTKFEALTEAVVPVLVEIRLASDNPKLSLSDAPEQVRLIGASRKAWKDTADLQSSRIDAMAVESARLKALNADLRKRAEAAIAKRDTAIRRLEQDALTPGERVDCARQLFDAEAALDLVYQEGL